MRNFVLAAVSAVAFASAAQAAPTIDFDGRTGTFGNPNVTATPFTDTITFTIDQAGVLGATISSNSTDALSNIDFTSVLLNNVAFTPVSTGQFEFQFLSNYLLTPGVQTLVISGVSGGNAAYSGTLSFTPATTAVPEPATWAMLVGGFGLLGTSLRRRQSVRTSVQAV